MGIWARRVTLFTLCGASAALVASACSSDDSAKKRVPVPPFGGSGGDAGDSSSAAGDSSTAASGALSGSTSQGGASDAGASGAAEAGAGSQCPTGFGDCDTDPADCETPLNLLTSCGACDVSCSQANAVVACTDLKCTVTSCTAGFGDCNDDGTDGCEAPLNTVKNCGSCGNDCGTAACNAGGYCAAVAFGSALSTYREVLTDSALFRLKITPQGYFVPTGYTLVRTPLDGSAEVIMDDQPTKAIGGLTADSSFVYWAVGGTTSGVFKKALGAAAAVAPTPVFAPASLPYQLRIQGTALYWPGQDGNIYTRSMSAVSTDPGALIVSNLQGTGANFLHQDFVTTPTRLYWVVPPNGGSPNLGFLRTAPIAGGASADVAGAVPKPWVQLAVSGEDVYFAQVSNSAFDGVWHYKAGGTAELLVSHGGISAVAVDSGFIYFMESNTKLFKAPAAGGVATQIGVGPGTAMEFAGFDAKSVFGVGMWTQGGGFGAAAAPFTLPK